MSSSLVFGTVGRVTVISEGFSLISPTAIIKFDQESTYLYESGMSLYAIGIFWMMFCVAPLT